MRLWLRQMRRISALVVAIPLLPASNIPVVAQSPDANRSKVTTIDLKSCKTLKKFQDGISYLCPGLGPHKVYVAEGDLRFFVAVGAKPETTKAAEQTLRPFNTIFKGRSDRASLEWRLGTDRARDPYATIIRYFTDLDGTKGEVLVVSKVGGGQSCHLAMIDALANPNAIELARTIADERAISFDCSKDEAKAIGQAGKSPM